MGTLLFHQLQGSSRGLALFSLAIHPLIRDLSSVFNLWYLNDGILGGTLQSITEDLKAVLHKSTLLGLNLYLSKCELYVSGADTRLSVVSGVVNQLYLLAPGIRMLDPSEVMLLGSPLTTEALSPAVFAHNAFYLLHHCFTIPKCMVWCMCKINQ